MLPVGQRTAADTRVLDSDYFLSREFVDVYKDEVKNKTKTSGPQVKTKRPGDITESEEEDDDDDDENETGAEGTITEGGGDPTDGRSTDANVDTPSVDTPSSAGDDVEKALVEKIRAACVSNWKAASADDKKKMWSIFDESGVFACACRHGFCLWLADMVRSGEL